ncbi:MAG: fibronectin type III domain-containing protein [Paludibacteraceae bacterium]|nr:fibronectin type III domain-containing protein [Paludibacteraceae bacterium]
MKHNFSFLAVLFSMLLGFTTMTAQTPAGYTLLGTNKYGYEDLTSKVSVQAQGTVTYDSGVITGKGLPGRICETGNYLQLSFTEATAMTLSDNYAIHITLSKVGEPAGNVQVSFCNNGWNATRVSYIIENSAILGEDIALNFTDRKTDNWNSFGETNSYGENRSFSGEIFRICAADGEQFAISQIYIKANVSEPDPIEPTGDEDAPTNLTAEVKSVADVSAVITVSAEDANAITFNVYNGEKKITSASSTSGVAKDIEVKGLTPETEYTLAVEAVDAAGNVNTNRVNVTFTTTEQLEKRYYFFRAGDIPTIEKMTAVDLREGVGTTLQLNNMTKGEETDYISYKLSGAWFSFNQNLKAGTDMADVNQDAWTLVIKMRTSNTDQSFNIRLNNAGECYQVSQGNLPVSAEWQELKLALADSKKPLTFTNNMTGTIFQMHANGSVAEDYVDIEYAYLTNVPANPETPQEEEDTQAPVNISMTVKDGSLTANGVILLLYAEDENSPITYAVKYQVKGSGDTWTEVPAFTGEQGTTVEKEIMGLTPETTYTFSVIASDPSNNAAEAVVLDDITTAQAIHTSLNSVRDGATAIYKKMNAGKIVIVREEQVFDIFGNLLH